MRADECSRNARAELRAVDAQIARAKTEAQDSFAVRLATGGGKAPFICRKRGDAMVECTALSAPESGKVPPDWRLHDPEARLARLDAQRQSILKRMMKCRSAPTPPPTAWNLRRTSSHGQAGLFPYLFE